VRHRFTAKPRPHRNIRRPSFTPRHRGAKEDPMDIVALVMLGAVALWFAQQFNSTGA
jgi:hypothetical protein